MPDAKVFLYLSDYTPPVQNQSHIPSGSLYHTQTDSTGVYTFKNVKKALYTVLIFKDSMSVCRQFNYTGNNLELSPDTVHYAGSLKLTLRHTPYRSVKNATIELLETPYSSSTDSHGTIQFKQLPPGPFTARITSSLPGYTPITSQFTIEPHKELLLEDTLRLPLTGIPAVEFVSATQDTAKGTVEIVWNTTYEQTRDFLIFRKIDRQKSFGMYPISLVNSKKYTDTLFSNESNTNCFSVKDTLPHSCSYIVQIRNKAGKCGPTLDTVSLNVLSPEWVSTKISVRSSDTLVSINDSVWFEVAYFNRTRPLSEIQFITDETVKRQAIGTKTKGKCAFPLSWTTPGKKKVIITAVDKAGASVSDSIELNVVQDIPVAHAGKDTVAGLNDPVFLHATAIQNFGKIVLWEWATEDSDYTSCSDGKLTVITPGKPTDSWKCFLRVTDDDGNTAFDTLSVKVISIPPKVKLTADTLIGLYEPLHLSGNVTDNGTIASIQWDIGNTGHFVPASTTDTILLSHRDPDSCMTSVLKVIDDDGEVATDTAHTHIALLLGHVNPLNKIPERNNHASVEFKECMWIIGGQQADIWKTVNGVNWQQTTDKAPFGKRSGHSVSVFKGKLWLIDGRVNGALSNEVWNSSDGTHWKRVGSTPFPKRQYHSSIVFKDCLWVIGGFGETGNEPCFSDIWNSPDGIHWTIVTDTPGFKPRYGQGTVVFNDTMYIIGGFYDGLDGSTSLSDVWSSADGKNWRRSD